VTRIGLLGGSFDPVHEAHLALARCACDTLALDRLKWLPAGRPWQKAGRELASDADRLAITDGKSARLPDGTNYWHTFFVLGLDHGR